MIDTLLNLVFPVNCVLCGTRATEWRCGVLCVPCTERFVRAGPPFCRRCGLPQSTNTTIPGLNGLCGACLSGETRFDLARSALSYDAALRTAIHHFKYNDHVSLARPFSRAMAECLARSPFTAERVIPVPLHRKRERQRGYNQTMLLARRLGLDLEPGLLRRTRPTTTQTGLSRRQRMGNVRGAFESRKGLEGTFLVVDDVMTTGATANEITRVLKANGASRVEILTLTRVPGHEIV